VEPGWISISRRAWTELAAALLPPEQNLRIQQQIVHLIPKARSTSGGSGASKSFRMRILPFNDPKPLRAVLAGPTGTRRAIGFPAFAITTSSPLAAQMRLGGMEVHGFGHGLSLA
jgi:hypothetical protein